MYIKYVLRIKTADDICITTKVYFFKYIVCNKLDKLLILDVRFFRLCRLLISAIIEIKLFDCILYCRLINEWNSVSGFNDLNRNGWWLVVESYLGLVSCMCTCWFYDSFMVIKYHMISDYYFHMQKIYFIIINV